MLHDLHVIEGFIPDRFAQHGGSPVDPSLPDPSEIVTAVAWQCIYDPISELYVDLRTFDILICDVANNFAGPDACSEMHYTSLHIITYHCISLHIITYHYISLHHR